MLLASTFRARATVRSRERAPLPQAKSLMRALCALLWQNSLRGRRQAFLDSGRNCLWSPSSSPETCLDTQHLRLSHPSLVLAWLCLERKLNYQNKVNILIPLRLSYPSPGCPFPPISVVCEQLGATWMRLKAIRGFVRLATQNLPKRLLEPQSGLLSRRFGVIL